MCERQRVDAVTSLGSEGTLSHHEAPPLPVPVCSAASSQV